MNMQWLYSTNAKEIGTLYLIFSIFAGMIGTAFSVLIKNIKKIKFKFN